MPRILINSLEGPALEWTVARILGFNALTYHPTTGSVTSRQPNGLARLHNYTTNWNLTGPLLHEHSININYCQDLCCGGRERLYIHCSPFQGKELAGYWRGSHDRPLTAGLRCFVRLKTYGNDFVEVPDGIPSSA